MIEHMFALLSDQMSNLIRVYERAISAAGSVHGG
jgi:hypothetical protein